jgi:hypothetical protein
MGFSMYLLIRNDINTTIEIVINVFKSWELMDLCKIPKMAKPKLSFSK